MLEPAAAPSSNWAALLDEVGGQRRVRLVTLVKGAKVNARLHATCQTSPFPESMFHGEKLTDNSNSAQAKHRTSNVRLQVNDFSFHWNNRVLYRGLELSCIVLN